MPSAKPNKITASERIAIIDKVKNELAFYVLVLLVVEATLGGLAYATTGQTQVKAIYAMLVVFVLLIVVVAVSALKQPGRDLRQFCGTISGYWWEKIYKHPYISFVDIGSDPATSTVVMNGRAYGIDATSGCELAAVWKTKAVCVNPGKREVFYLWEGWHPSRVNEVREGFGEISFETPVNSATGDVRLKSGTGRFLDLDTSLKDRESITFKSVQLERCTDEEVRVMEQSNTKLVAALIESKLDRNTIATSKRQ